MMRAYIHLLNCSPGGVPKTPVADAVLTPIGLTGDQQRDRRHHGGPERALCLFSLEVIAELQAEGHPIFPGSAGENVTISGLEWAALAPGARLALGHEAVIEIISYTTPCRTISNSFRDGQFKRISHKLHPGQSRLYARVITPGRLAAGQLVRLLNKAPD
ncbi:MAG: MOSC domain-containing protein [Acidobacteriota bacterium]|nr:MOSC domain-containing protein [Acidobacteriota bacterium]